MNATGFESILTGALYFTIGSALVLGLAAVGELIQERSGVLNIGLEAVFIAGALGGFWTAHELGNPWMGYVGGAIAAGIVGALFASLVVGLKMNQVVVGILFVTLALATADVLWDQLFGLAVEPPTLPDAADWSIPLLSKIPVLGRALFQRNPAEYAAVVVIGLVTAVLYHTRFGLILRGTGEAPEAIHFSGRNVNTYRVVAVVAGSALAGLGGALLTVGQLGFYAPGVTAGRGWIAIAIVIMGGWRPWSTLLAALVFGAADMLQYEVQAANIDIIPHEFLVAFPYVVAVLALVVRRASTRPPTALGLPFSSSANR